MLDTTAPYANGPRRIVLLGSTGSIGTQTLDVVSRLGAERAVIVGLAARRNVSLLAQQACATHARHVGVTDDALVSGLANLIHEIGVDSGSPLR